MTNILVEGREQVELADIGVQAERAKKILAKVRKAMLAPNAQKEPPHFSPAQLAAWSTWTLARSTIAPRREAPYPPAG